MSKHSICHIEWAVTDLERSKKFFGGLFEWTFEAFGNDYAMFKTPNDELGGGLMVEKEVHAGQSPCVYILVDKIEPYLDKAATLGGGVCVPKTEIPGMGWFAILSDPDKNGVGIFEAAKRD